jgi:ubiquitin-protein ligase
VLNSPLLFLLIETSQGPISESDFFTWEALICGPKDTPFVSNLNTNSRATYLYLKIILGRRRVRSQADICMIFFSYYSISILDSNQLLFHPFSILLSSLKPSDYPLSPFEMKFNPPLFHPNSKRTSSFYYIYCLTHTVYADGNVCISILHTPGDDPTMYEQASERWSPVQSVEKVILSVISMLAGEYIINVCEFGVG